MKQILRSLIFVHTVLGIVIQTSIFDAQNTLITAINFPFTNGTFGSLSNAASYVRVIASTSESQFLKTVSDHQEVRTDQRVKMVMWSPFAINSAMTELLVQSMQSFLSKTITNLDSANTFLPSTATELEIEILKVEESQYFRRPACSLEGSLGRLKCPSMFLFDSLASTGLMQSKSIMSLTRFLQKNNILSTVYKPERTNLQFSNEYYGAPIGLYTQLVGFSKSAFDGLKLKYPPPYSGTMASWTWKSFVQTAGTIAKAKGVGFRFQGSFSEELKLLSMIGRAYKTTLVNDSGQCALDAAPFSTAIQDTIVPLWMNGSAIANTDFLATDSNDFQQWLKNNLPDPRESTSSFCCKSYNQSWDAAMRIVPSFMIRSGISANGAFVDAAKADILPAYVPGGNGYFGTYAIGIASTSVSPTFAFTYMASLISSPTISALAEIFGSIPPYTTFTASKNAQVAKTQLENAFPLISSSAKVQNSDRFVSKNPIRKMLMEIVFKKSSVAVATTRACALINAMSLPSCERQKVAFDATKCDSLAKVVLSDAQAYQGSCQIDQEVLKTFAATKQCGYVPYDSAGGMSVYVLAGSGFLFAIGIIAMGAQRQFKFGISADDHQSFLILFFGVIILVSAVLDIGTPTFATCTTNFFLSTLGYSVIFGILGLFSNSSWLESKKILLARIYSRVALISLVSLILLLFWIFFSASPSLVDSKAQTDFDGNQIVLQVATCLSPKWPIPLTALLVSFVLILCSIWENKYRNVRVLLIASLTAIIIYACLIFIPLVLKPFEITLMIAVSSCIFVFCCFMLLLVHPSKQSKFQSQSAASLHSSAQNSLNRNSLGSSQAPTVQILPPPPKVPSRNTTDSDFIFNSRVGPLSPIEHLSIYSDNLDSPVVQKITANHASKTNASTSFIRLGTSTRSEDISLSRVIDDDQSQYFSGTPSKLHFSALTRDSRPFSERGVSWWDNSST